MRDALSLLDQSIAHGAGKVEEEQVTHMLGTVGDDHLYAVLDALVTGNVPGLLAVADGMEARSLSFDAALQSLATLLHRIALAQYAPAAIADDIEHARIGAYTDAFDAEFLQLAYQITIHGRAELALAPDEYVGFTMTLLRLHAFRPEQAAALGSPGLAPAGSGQARSPGADRGALPAAPSVAGNSTQRSGPSANSARQAPRMAAAPVIEAALRSVEAGVECRPASASAPASASPVLNRAESVTQAMPAVSDEALAERAPGGDHDVPPWEDLPPEAYAEQRGAPEALVPRTSATADEDGESVRSSAHPPAPEPRAESAVPPAAKVSLARMASTDAAALLAMGDWRGLIRVLELGGLVRELAQHCEWVDLNGADLQLRLSTAHRHLLDMNRGAVDRLQDLIGNASARPIRVHIEIGDIAGETPAARDEIERRLRHADAVAALEADPFVRELIERFDATLAENSVKPL